MSSLHIDHPLAYMAERCKDRLRSDDTTNYHIFLNSVDDICSIISGAGLTPENTKVVCSVSEGNKEKNNAKLPDGFSIGIAGDDPKLFNFYTSTCFEGQDIMDENGMTFIVSDSLKQHTMMDISTSFVQICGRIRNSRYRNRITQIYSTSRYRKAISAEEYEKETMEKLERTQEHIKWMNECPKELRPAFLKQIPYMNEPYVQEKEGMVILDRNMAYQDIVNFKIVNMDYCTRVNMKNCLQKANIKVKESVSVHQEDSALPTLKKASFRELFETYCQIRQSNVMSMTEDERVTYIRIYKPLVIEAYDSLGPDRVREMKYHVSNIKREIASKGSLKEDYKIAKMLSAVLPMQEAIPVKKIKQELQKIYDAIGKKATAKATDVSRWFEIREVQKKINGSSTRCIILVNKKLVRVFND
ncbi:MAG: hypothetical protein IJ202_06355 [Bacteroidales bacterium]|nr:hypothetical protein [Bacteroidales bacterium]